MLIKLFFFFFLPMVILSEVCILMFLAILSSIDFNLIIAYWHHLYAHLLRPKP
jgi:phosphoglycerol transferase MdoB-like AlkP superfamily enzyme